MRRVYLRPGLSEDQSKLMFSSLAMAEMTTLTSAIYRRYQTCPAPGYEGVTPGITSRFEVFYDDQVPEMRVSS